MKQKTNKLAQFKQWILSIVMWRFLGLFVTCTNCNNGYLTKIDTYHHGENMDINIYKCSECSNRTAINVT